MSLTIKEIKKKVDRIKIKIKNDLKASETDIILQPKLRYEESNDFLEVSFVMFVNKVQERTITDKMKQAGENVAKVLGCGFKLNSYYYNPDSLTYTFEEYFSNSRQSLEDIRYLVKSIPSNQIVNGKYFLNILKFRFKLKWKDNTIGSLKTELGILAHPSVLINNTKFKLNEFDQEGYENMLEEFLSFID